MKDRCRDEDLHSREERSEWIDLGAWIDGECEGDDQIELRDRLASDRALRAKAERLRAAESLLREHDPAGAVACDSEALLRSVHERLETEPAVASRGTSTGLRRWRRVGFAGLAAAALVVVAWLAWPNAKRGVDVSESGLADGGSAPDPRGMPESVDRTHDGEIRHADTAPVDRDRIAETDDIDALVDRGSAPENTDRDRGADRVRTTEPSRSFASTQTLAVIEDDWPLRCRARARDLLASAYADAREPATDVAVDDGPNTYLVELDRLGRDAIPAVLDLLEDEDPDRRSFAFDVLLRFDDPSTLPALASVAVREDRVGDALAAMEDRGGRDAVAALEILAREPGATERATLAIARIGTRGAIDALVRLHAASPDVRDAATVALGGIDSDAAASALLDLYDSGDTAPVLRLALRRHAAALGPRLVRRLGSSDASRAAGAIELLGEFRYRDAVEPLIARVRASRRGHTALVAALRCGGAHAVPAVMPWIDDGPDATSLADLRRLAACLDDAGVRAAAEVARSKKGDAGRNAVRLLAAAGDRAVDPLASVLRDGRHVGAVIDALATIGTDFAVEALADALPRDVERVRVITELLETGRDAMAIAWLRHVVDREGASVAARLVERIERDRSLRGRLSLD